VRDLIFKVNPLGQDVASFKLYDDGWRILRFGHSLEELFR